MADVQSEHSIRSNLQATHDASTHEPVLTIKPQISLSGTYLSFNPQSELGREILEETQSVLTTLLQTVDTKKAFLEDEEFARATEAELDIRLTKWLSEKSINLVELQEFTEQVERKSQIVPAITLNIDLSGTGHKLKSLVVPDFSEHTETVPSLSSPRKLTVCLDPEFKTEFSSLVPKIDDIEQHMDSELRKPYWATLLEGAGRRIGKGILQDLLKDARKSQPDVLQETEFIKSSYGWITFYLKKDLKELKGSDSFSSETKIVPGTHPNLTDNTVGPEESSEILDTRFVRFDTTITGTKDGVQNSVTRSLLAPLGGSDTFYVKSTDMEDSVFGWYECE